MAETSTLFYVASRGSLRWSVEVKPSFMIFIASCRLVCQFEQMFIERYYMRLVMLFVLIAFPFSAKAATPSTILSKGEILSSSEYTSDGRQYDVAYKGVIYRCYTWGVNPPGYVRCFQLIDK